MLAAPVGLSAAEDWVPLFNGKNLDGWKAGGNADSFKVFDGAIAADGPTSHLFYSGAVRGAMFKNFELKLEIKTQPLCNSGVYFHTRYQANGFPDEGFEVQVNNTALGEGNYRERKKTGSLYGVRNVYKAFARDGEWFPIHITVRGKQVQVRVNDLLLVDYLEADPPLRAQHQKGRILGAGTFALQCHDSGSKALFRNILVRPLPDDLPAPAASQPDELDQSLLELAAHNYPLVDYHVHLKSGWTLEDALATSRRTGIEYGIAVNCGLSFPVKTDAAARDFIASMKGKPVFVAMQAEGREWVRLFSKETVAAFDYVFSDAMTFSDDNGKRMRIWIPEETGQISDKQKFMDMLVDRIVGVLHEPIDIYANPTFLPEQLQPEYDALWTQPRMELVIEAARKNDVAVEINNRYRIPSAAFLKLAKSAGVKFSFGTNNTGSNIGRCEYAVRMVNECGIGWQNMFVPRPEGEKPVQRRGMPA